MKYGGLEHFGSDRNFARVIALISLRAFFFINVMCFVALVQELDDMVNIYIYI